MFRFIPSAGNGIDGGAIGIRIAAERPNGEADGETRHAPPPARRVWKAGSAHCADRSTHRQGCAPRRWPEHQEPRPPAGKNGSAAGKDAP
nr:MAG TPA: hypothetical protein [Herelleviridae sp.]